MSDDPETNVEPTFSLAGADRGKFALSPVGVLTLQGSYFARLREAWGREQGQRPSR